MHSIPDPALTQGRTTGRRGLLRGLRGRLGRRRGRDERGELVIETVSALALIPLILIAYVAANTATDHTEVETRFYTEAGQVAQSVLEESRARPWQCLGFNPAQDANLSSVDTAIGQVGHTVPTDCTPDSRLSPVADIAFKGTTFHVLTDVTWDTTATPTQGGSYGTKQTTVTVSWGDPKSGATFTRTLSEERRSTPAEAPVPGVATPDQNAPSL